MRSDSWLGVEPPKDAEGRVIPLDTEVLGIDVDLDRHKEAVSDED